MVRHDQGSGPKHEGTDTQEQSRVFRRNRHQYLSLTRRCRKCASIGWRTRTKAQVYQVPDMTRTSVRSMEGQVQRSNPKGPAKAHISQAAMSRCKEARKCRTDHEHVSGRDPRPDMTKTPVRSMEGQTSEEKSEDSRRNRHQYRPL